MYVIFFLDKKMKDDLISYGLFVVFFLKFILHLTSGDAD